MATKVVSWWKTPLPLSLNAGLAQLYREEYVCSSCNPVNESNVHSCHLTPRAARLVNICHTHELAFDWSLLHLYEDSLSTGLTMHGFSTVPHTFKRYGPILF